MAIDLERIIESPHILDILIQMEDVLDSMDIYVFENWALGEIVEGPLIKRYWLEFTLRYPHHRMPDPKAALRLMKHDIRVDFYEAEFKDGSEKVIETEEERQTEKMDDTYWMVRVTIPRRLVTQMSDVQNQFYADYVDVDDVDTAKDAGLGDESSVTNDGMASDDSFGSDGDDIFGGGN